MRIKPAILVTLLRGYFFFAPFFFATFFFAAFFFAAMDSHLRSVVCGLMCITYRKTRNVTRAKFKKTSGELFTRGAQVLPVRPAPFAKVV
ncbi:MAG TPA: hypothetical protein VFV96_08235 [Verrucomicrobiae bacterium]|nr:hypothetical protein [Verrucomicrobiae bacterium]